MDSVEIITIGIVLGKEEEPNVLTGIDKNSMIFCIPDRLDKEGKPIDWQVSTAHIARHSKHFGRDIRLLPVEELYELYLEAKEFILALGKIFRLQLNAQTELSKAYRNPNWQAAGEVDVIKCQLAGLRYQWVTTATDPNCNFERLPHHKAEEHEKSEDYMFLQVRNCAHTVPWLQWTPMEYEIEFRANYQATLESLRTKQERRDRETVLRDYDRIDRIVYDKV